MPYPKVRYNKWLNWRMRKLERQVRRLQNDLNIMARIDANRLERENKRFAPGGRYGRRRW